MLDVGQGSEYVFTVWEPIFQKSPGNIDPDSSSL